MAEYTKTSPGKNLEQYEDVVISGISGKFPECDNIQEFSDKLFSGEDMVTSSEKRMPIQYLDLYRMGILKDLSKFDAQYFGIPGKQADTTDPGLRILLELTYEAIVDAGVNPAQLRGSRTAVIIGQSGRSSERLWDESREICRDEFKYALLGHFKSMYSNRISYNFDLRGPSFTIDTACSSSSMALYNAVQLIRSGECDAAIIGGCNLCIDPNMSLQFNQLQMLSPDGKCKVFDASGNGFARAECACVIFIQKKSVARRIYCSVTHIGSNCDGFKVEGVTFPSCDVQADLLRKVYSEVNIDPSTVEYFEAHGTGTVVGDPEEVAAISEVFCGKNRANTLLIGSVKSNMGHAEPAAGMCGIAKILLILQKGQIPPNLHYNNPNKNIPALFDGRVKVVDKVTPYNGGLVGLNSFGFGGTNVHMLLTPNLKRKSKNREKSLPQLVAVSGRTEDGVRNFLKKIKQLEDAELNQLIRAIHQENMKNHLFKGYSILDAEQPMVHISEYCEEKRPVWFVFSGLGAHWAGMGKDLVRFKVFDESLRKTSFVLDQFGLNLYDLVVNEEASLNDMTKVIAGTTAVQIALVDLLRFLNIHPDGIFGHSSGELPASYADGAMTAAETILCAYYRGKCFVDSNSPQGAMASVGLSWAEAEARCPPDVYPACDNSADNVTISGHAESVKKFVEELQSEGKFAKEVDSLGGAFHTKYVMNSADLQNKYLKNIITNPKKYSPRWISTSIPESEWNSDFAQTCSTDYQVNNLLSPVYFRNAMTHIQSNAVVIEIGPHCLFQSIFKRSIPSTCVNIGLVNKRVQNNTEFFLSSVGKMYNAGLQPQIDALYPEITFPVSVDTSTISNLVEWDHSETWSVKQYKETQENVSMYNELVHLADEKDKFLSGHTIDGHVLYPAAGYLVLAWKCIAKLHFKKWEEFPVKMWNVKVHQATVLLSSSDVIFHVNYLQCTNYFEIRESHSLIVSGKISTIKDPEAEMVTLPSIPECSTVTYTGEDLYKELRLRGFEYNGLFKGICSSNSEGTSGSLSWDNNWITFIDTMMQISILWNIEKRKLALPTEVRYIIINPQVHESLKNGDIIPVKCNKDLEIIKAGGVEIRNLKLTVTIKKPARGPAPKLEKYIYTPYIGAPEMKETLSYEDALTVTLQIVIENLTGIQELNIIKIAENKSPGKIITPDIASVLLEVPLVNPNMTVVVQNVSEFLRNETNPSLGINYDEMKSLDYMKIESTDVLLGSSAMSQGQSSNFIFKFYNMLKPGAFIILEASQEAKTSETINGLLVISSQLTNNNKEILLLRKPTNSTWRKIVHFTEKNFDWVNNLKEALRENESTNEKIVVQCHGEEKSGIIGFINCLRLEPGGKNLRCIFSPSEKLQKLSIEDSFYKDLAKKDLFMNVYVNNTWGSYRHIGIKDSTINSENAFINTATPGDLSSLKWIQGPHLSDTNLCYVYYASLNFEDFMLATNQKSQDTVPKETGPQDSVLGFEFCGRNVKGERVFGLIDSCALATTLTADPLLTWKVPNHWTMEHAATVPVVYFTVYYALILRGDMKPGQSILIHAGAGGVGIAAITVALSMNVTVYTTVSTKKKREFLKNRFPQLSDRHFANSRDTTFEQHILHETGGRGVDMVLNSLAEDKLHASARCLANGGKFLEIGKYDIFKNNPLGMALFQKNTTFHGIFMDQIISRNTEEKRVISKLFQQGLDSGIVKPLPAIVYSSHEAEQAFRLLASGSHIGKVMLKIRDEEAETIVLTPRKICMEAIPRAYFKAVNVYIIIGGLGGMGLELADWMITRGARKIVLTSRTGVKNGYQSLCISRWLKMGADITVSTTDCTTKNGATQLLKESSRYGPIGGIFNLALVLKDALFENQSDHSFVECCTPKAEATKILDEISRELCPHLDYFVVFSSFTCGRGNSGQSNYGLANSVMERTCELRKAMGLPAIAIQWGPVGDAGFVAETMAENANVKDLLSQRISSCLKTLDIFLRQPHPVVSSMVLAVKSSIGKMSSSIVGPVQFVANILGVTNLNDVNPDKTLAQMGVDSLMIAEIKQVFERSFSVSLSVEDIRSLTFTQIERIQADKSVENTVSTQGMCLKLEKRPTHLLPLQVATDVLIKLPSKTTQRSTNMNVFIVHPIQGVVSMLKPLAYDLPANVYGLQLTSDTPLNSVENIASHYIQHIKSIQSKGPYLISGYSFGVIIALEIGIQLENAGENVSLVMLDGALKHVIPLLKYEEKLMENMHDGNKITILSLLVFMLLCGKFDLMESLNHLLTLHTNEERLLWVVKEVIPILQCSEDEVKIGIKNITKLMTVGESYSPKSKFSGDVFVIKSTSHSVVESKDGPYDLQQVCEKKIIENNINGSHEDITENEETVKKVQEIFTLVINKINVA